MYKVVFKYNNGHCGTCIADGKVILFETKQDALRFADKKNRIASELEYELRDHLPTWHVEEA